MDYLNKLKAFLRQKSEIKAQGNELMLYGIIGDYEGDPDGLNTVKTIKQMQGDISVFINSPGGSVYAGIPIMNAFSDHQASKGQVTFYIDGLAASIASIIPMAKGAKVVMREGSRIMIHNAWGITADNADGMRKMALLLDKVDDDLSSIYERRTGIAQASILDMMKITSWIGVDDAIRMGFADSSDKKESSSVKNFDLSIFENVPDDLKAATRDEKPKTIRDLENVLHKAGFSRSEARAVASNGMGNLPQRDVAEELDSEKLLAAINSRKY